MNKPVDMWEQIIREFYHNNEIICKKLNLKEIGDKLLSINTIKTLDVSENEIKIVPN